MSSVIAKRSLQEHNTVELKDRSIMSTKLIDSSGENLLSSSVFTDSENEFMPPRRDFIQRPVSGDSTGTRTTELFSAVPSDRESSNGSLDERKNKDDAEEEQEEEVKITKTKLEYYKGWNSKTLSELVENNNDSNTNLLKRQSVPYSQTKLNNDVLSSSTQFPRSNSTSALQSFLTPSQRYRLRHSQNQSNLRRTLLKEDFYNSQDIEPLPLDLNSDFKSDSANNSLVWNIPMANVSTNSFINGSIKGLDSSDIPTTSIPGVGNSNGNNDSEFMQLTSEGLSSTYGNLSHKMSQNNIRQREESAGVLPMELKRLSDQGMEDLRLVSTNKLNVLSIGRPSWLPPKSSSERKIHEREILANVEAMTKEELNRNRRKTQYFESMKLNQSKVQDLMERGIVRQSSLLALKKLIWETPLPSKDRIKIYDEILQSDQRFVTSHFIEPFEEVMHLLNRIGFTRDKELELQKLVEFNIENKASYAKEKFDTEEEEQELFHNLLLLLELKSISQQGLRVGDEKLFYHILRERSCGNLEEVWQIVNLIQMTCFDGNCRDKYDTNIINTKGITGYYLNNNYFKDELVSDNLNLNTWWNIMEHVNHNLFMWIMDIIIIENSQCFHRNPIKVEKFQNKEWAYYRDCRSVSNYKILISLTLNILLNYHYGFRTLKALKEVKEKTFAFPVYTRETDQNMETLNNRSLIDKWSHYYSKF